MSQPCLNQISFSFKEDDFQSLHNACQPLSKYVNSKYATARSTLVFSNVSGLVKRLAHESPLKVIKNAFYFTSKALFVLKIFKFLS